MKIAQEVFGIDCVISVDTDGFQIISTNGTVITYESIKKLIEKINE